MSEEQKEQTPEATAVRKTAGARPTRGGAAGARPTRGGAAGARPTRGGAAGARPTRGGAAGARTAAGAATSEEKKEGEAATEAPKGPAMKPQLVLKKFCPVYIVRSNGEEDTCTMCRNQLDQVCTKCQTDKITDPNLCPVIQGKCGHKFHKHCLEGWLKKSPYCPGASCGLRWENA